jgi:hypothetical protein
MARLAKVLNPRSLGGAAAPAPPQSDLAGQICCSASAKQAILSRILNILRLRISIDNCINFDTLSFR